MEADDERVLNGEQPSDPAESDNAVKKLPDNFNKWVDKNASRIIKNSTLPYFIVDNSVYVTDRMHAKYPNTRISEQLAHPQFFKYIASYRGRSEKFDAMYQRYKDGGMNDAEKSLLISQMKNECAKFTLADFKKAGIVDENFIVARTELNSVVVKGGTRWAKGKPIDVEELKMDIIVFKDKYGKELAYPIGSGTLPFSAIEASEAIHELPPYLRQGIKRVSFLNTPNPLDPYWSVKYDKPNFVSMATDGGSTTFWMQPKEKADFKGYMAHEAGHIIDKETHRFSASAGWQEAVSLDDKIYSNVNGVVRVSEYAETNNEEDFAECMKAYIMNHEKFKNDFPNRAAFIRLMAQRLSGHSPKH